MHAQEAQLKTTYYVPRRNVLVGVIVDESVQILERETQNGETGDGEVSKKDSQPKHERVTG